MLNSDAKHSLKSTFFINNLSRKNKRISKVSIFPITFKFLDVCTVTNNQHSSTGILYHMFKYLDTPLCITYSSLSSFFTFFPLSGYALPPPPGWGCHFFQVSHPGIGTMTSIAISAVRVISSRVRIEWSGQMSSVWIAMIPNPASISSMSPVSKSTRHSENQQ